jgi:hypothetical protein
MATCFDEDWDGAPDTHTDYCPGSPFGSIQPPTYKDVYAGSTLEQRAFMHDPFAELLGSGGEEDERRQEYLEGAFSMSGRAASSSSSSVTAPVDLAPPPQVKYVFNNVLFAIVDQRIPVLIFQARGVVVAVHTLLIFSSHTHNTIHIVNAPLSHVTFTGDTS